MPKRIFIDTSAFLALEAAQPLVCCSLPLTMIAKIDVGELTMKRVKGIYENQTVKLLEKVEAEDGIEVEVIFTGSYQEAKARQLRYLDNGFHMGKTTHRSRAELHER